DGSPIPGLDLYPCVVPVRLTTPPAFFTGSDDPAPNPVARRIGECDVAGRVHDHDTGGHRVEYRAKEFTTLPKGLFRLLAIGDVERKPDDAGNVSSGVAEWRELEVRRHRPVLDHESDDVAAERLATSFKDSLAVRRVGEQITDRLADG